MVKVLRHFKHINSSCIILLLFWYASLGVHSTKCRHQSPEWTILSHVDCFIQAEVIGFQVLLDSLYHTWRIKFINETSSIYKGKYSFKVNIVEKVFKGLEAVQNFWQTILKSTQSINVCSTVMHISLVKELAETHINWRRLSEGTDWMDVIVKNNHSDHHSYAEHYRLFIHKLWTIFPGNTPQKQTAVKTIIMAYL